MEQEKEREGEAEPRDQPGIEEVGEKTGAGREVEEDVSATYSGDRPYRCEICGRRFKLPIHLGRHMTTIHKEEKKLESKAKAKAVKKEEKARKTRYLAKTVPCPICGKRLAPQGMPNHIKMHEKEGKGPDLKTLVTEAVSEGVEQIVEKIPGIVDEFSKNDERLLHALEKNGWNVKVKEAEVIVLVKGS